MRTFETMQLTAAQQDIYLEGKLFGGVLNNIGGFQKYRCRLDITRFKRAREHVLLGNDAYRLRFHEEASECHAVLSDQPPSALRVLECPTEAAAQAWIQAQFECAFADLSCEVFQDALISLPGDEYWYFAKAHHLMMDGWGFALQMQRILHAYEAQAHPAEEGYRRSYPSFAEYMERQASYRDSPQYAQNRIHWLARHERPAEPLFEPRSKADDGTCSERVSVAFNTASVGALHHLAGAADANLAAVFVSALTVYFCRSYQRSDIVIGSPVHNRRNAVDKDIIGSFVNVNAHRFDAPNDESFIQLLGQVASVQRQDYRHSRYNQQGNADSARRDRMRQRGGAEHLWLHPGAFDTSVRE
ncbi:hypothetical protein FHW69_002845 [Luteibacter sp. Sphag1AF]|uniref:condensation domain-containing protein n=1 Tax=Luteibacter sp. Sphag1AF TaxID=2587031 RepID=UPI001616D24F|nr:condensation domain-containing protein [Luteibacter sp. Sphag1AF]MBB3228210.1 hypothetical protein [Luteibacter sp. Sphag1AF]